VTFNSIEFAAFLAVVLALHWSVPPRWRNRVLLVASYGFYGWWDPRLLALLAGSTLVDHVVATRIGALDPADGPHVQRRRTRLLAVSIVANLGVLGVFKYAGFFLDSLTGAITALGLAANPPLLQIVLPIGISFYTFQSIAYTVDVHRGVVRPVRSLATFATYIAYFPQLVAGPIERAGRLLPQLQDPTRAFPCGAALERAVSLIVLGLVRKVVLADGVAPIVADAFDAPGQRSWLALAGALLAFALQIYGDFAGYSAIARGVSALFGIRLMANFAEPYLSRDISEFWRRWHISLSTWLRDYLYIPLGGNRGSTATTMRNLALTMLLGGLWHGASWTFVVWGGLHGLFLAIHRLLPRRRSDPAAPLRPADTPRVLGTFVLVCTAWAFFRAETVGQALTVLGRIVTLKPGTTVVADLLLVLVMAIAALLLDLAQRRQAALPARHLLHGPVRTGLAGGVAATLLLVFSGGTPQPFVYFQF
jgi:D-alanyl-lipoteichoic acid acyltransferase DltB (MBOAT superfamily)